MNISQLQILIGKTCFKGENIKLDMTFVILTH